MDHHPSSTSSRSDRKTIEKKRRIQMKALYSQLNSLLPHHHLSREPLTLPDQLDEAAKYIKKLQVNVERMKERKTKLMGFERSNSMCNRLSESAVAFKQPRLEIQEMGSSLQIILVTSLDQKFFFNEIIHVLHDEEGIEVSHAVFSLVDYTVFHTMHCKVEECGRGHMATRRIAERLKKLVSDASSAVY